MLEDDASALGVIDSVHETMSSIKSSIVNAAMLRNITDLRPKLNNDTRWSSKYEMLARYCRIYDEISLASNQEGSTIRFDEITASLRSATKLKNQLEEINEVMKYLQTRHLPLVQGRWALDELEKTVQQNKNKPDHALYRCKFKLQKAAAVSTHTPDHAFESGVCKIQSERHDELTPQEVEACACLRKALARVGERRGGNEADSPVSMAERIKRMKSTGITKPTESPYHDCSFLFASTAEVERLWSLALHVFSTKRRSMTPRLMEAILFLQYRSDCCVADFPWVACGSARGDVYVGNLETGDVVAIGQVEQDADDYDDEEKETEFELAKRLEKVVRVLFNGYDGGGTLALAFDGNLICEARRSGGVYLWRWDRESDRLVPQGCIPGVRKDALVTTLHLDTEYLWVGTVEGLLQAYSLSDSEYPLALQQTPEMAWQFGETITSLALSPTHACGAVATAAGSVHLFSLEDEDVVLGSFYPPFDARERKAVQAFASSVCFVETNAVSGESYNNNNNNNNKRSATKVDIQNDDTETDHGLFVACGGNDGSIFLQPIALASTGEVDGHRPFAKPLRPLRPKHFAPAKCLASPLPGILVSAGQDGGIRVWDIAEAMCLYQFVGYKVWMGSLWTDGDRLVSDGADNTVVVHDFTKGSEP